MWYASDQEQAAWAELMRHFLDEGVDPFEIRRRVGRVTIHDLTVLDLTKPHVLAALGLSEADLIGDDYAGSQDLATAAAAGFGGILAPSAAKAGQRTLVVFASSAATVVEDYSRVRQPPPRLADLLRAIRPHPDMPRAVRDFLASLAALGADAVRQRRR